MANIVTHDVWRGARTANGGSSDQVDTNGWYQAVLSGTFNGATVTLNVDGEELTDAEGTANGSFTAAFNLNLHIAGTFTAVVSSAGGSTSLTLILTKLRG